MCWQCAHPGTTRDEYMDYLVAKIAQYGWSIQYVEHDRHHPPFAYTVGLTSHGFPELAVTGATVERSAHLLNGSAIDLHRSGGVSPGERWAFADTELEAVEVSTPDAHLLVACELYDRQVEAVQLVYCDDRGKWPWEVGYRKRRWNQYLMGPRAGEKTVGGGL